LNLSQTAGPEVVLSVGTFVARLEALGADVDGRPDATGREARALLARRGLTAEVVAQARSLLDRLAATAEAEEAGRAPDAAHRERQTAAEAALWGWYREWSTITRAVIANRNHLRQLGFLQRLPSDDATEPDDTAALDDLTEPTDGIAAPVPPPAR
jgi:hypothetical protein